MAQELGISVEELLAGEKNSQLVPRADRSIETSIVSADRINTRKILISIAAIIFSANTFLVNITSVFSYFAANGNVFIEGNGLYAVFIILNYLLNACFWGAALGVSIGVLFMAIGHKSELIMLCIMTMFLSCAISLLAGIFLFITQAEVLALLERFLMLFISAVVFIKFQNGEDWKYKFFFILIIFIFIFEFIIEIKMIAWGTTGKRLAGYSYLMSSLKVFAFWLAIGKALEKDRK